MDLFYFIILWLKTILEQLKSITSFVGSNFLPEVEGGKDDDDNVVQVHSKIK